MRKAACKCCAGKLCKAALVWCLLSIVVCVGQKAEKNRVKWQINKHPKTFARKLRILRRWWVLIDGISSWFPPKGMHPRQRMRGIRAWSSVKSHRKYQVSAKPIRDPLSSALLYIQPLACCFARNAVSAFGRGLGFPPRKVFKFTGKDVWNGHWSHRMLSIKKKPRRS